MKNLENFIRNPQTVWYGPYPCEKCGATIVNSSRSSGRIALDAEFNHHYPNYKWQEHKCKEINYENFGANDSNKLSKKVMDVIYNKSGAKETTNAINKVGKGAKDSARSVKQLTKVLNDFNRNGCTCDPNVQKSKLQEVLTDLSKEQEKRLKKAGINVEEELKELIGKEGAKEFHSLLKKKLLEKTKIYRNTNLNYLDLKRDDKGHFLPKYKTHADFTYCSAHTGLTKKRHIEVTEKDKDYIIGKDIVDDYKVKQFRKDRIIGKVTYFKVGLKREPYSYLK
jgi:hypothetical protein